jgi:hypothetical protein
MRNAFFTAGAALVFGGLALTGPAQAVSPLSFNGTSLVIQVEDLEDQEVGHDLRPDIVPAPSATEGEAEKGAAMEHPKGEGEGGNIENQEIWHDLDTGVTPPPAAVGE